MKYNFDRIIDRRHTHSVKWDLVEEIYGGSELLPMWVADMDFETAPCVAAALEHLAKTGVFGYPHRPQSYKDAVKGWMKRRHGWVIEDDWLSYSPGVVTALSLCILAYSRPGDRVIIQPPVYYPFAKCIENNGRRVANNPLKFENNRYVMDFENLEKRATNRTRLMIISSPHNPVGRVWTSDELQKVGEFCVKNDIVLVSDEIHSDLIYKGYKHIPTASVSEDIARQTITCMAPSKTFNLAGLKTSSIIISNPALRKMYNAMLGNLSIGMDNSFGLVALEAAYTHGEDWLEELLVYLEANRDYVEKYIETNIPGINVIPCEGTYLLWLDCRALDFEDKALDEFMLKKAKLWLDDGPMFGPGGEGFQRINIACPRSTLEEALSRLKRAVKERALKRLSAAGAWAAGQNARQNMCHGF